MNFIKVAFIIDSLGMGGKERQLLELLNGLNVKSKIKFILILLSDNIHYNNYKDLNCTVFILKRKIRKDPLIFFELAKIFKEFKPDIIHSWDFMSSIYVIPFILFSNIKFINGAIRNAPNHLKLFSKSWLRSKTTFPFSHLIIANSIAGLSSYNTNPNKSLHIYSGINTQRIKNLESPESIKNKFSIITQYVIGMVASFSSYKDYTTFINAAMHILEKRDDVIFLTIGEGPNQEKFKKMVKPEFQKGIKFLGKQKDVESIVNIFDIGVLCTYTEGISNSIMEYMALGIPVIATNGGGTSEIVVNDKTGFLIKPEHVGELVEKIEFLLHNKEKAVEIGIEGNNRLLMDFSLENMIEKYINVYQKCIRSS